MVKELLQFALQSFPDYNFTPDALFYNGEPYCSLNNLKEIRAHDQGIVLEFDDAESINLSLSADTTADIGA